MALYIDIVDGARGRKSQEYGWELERKAIVTGIDSTLAASARLLEAVLCTVGMPEIGDPHPNVAACILREIIPTAITSEKVELRLVYRERGADTQQDGEWPESTIEVGASAIQIQTSKDKDDTNISVAYHYPDEEKFGEWKNATFTTDEVVGKMIPNNTIVVSRRETTTGDFLNWLGKNYVGKINYAGWYLAPGDAAGTWLCTAIRGRSYDGGVTYDVEYNFQYRADAWTENVKFIDHFTGKPPADVIKAAGGGDITVDIYEKANFNNLRL